MKPEDLKLAADVLRRLADEIESGKWRSVSWEVENDHRDKPIRAGGSYRGVDLIGRWVRVRMGMPASDVRAEG